MFVAVSACSHPEPRSPAAVAARPDAPPARPKLVRLVALPAESDAFPRAAQAMTESLSRVQLDGLGAAHVSKVSLEIVQLSIECVDPSVACYEAVGHSLTANRLLFAQIAPLKRKQLKITVTLFDVDARAQRTRAERVFASEADATAGIAELVAEATRL
jgi:hypothetical protein